MKKKENTFQKIKRKLLSKYRLVIINEETFEEQVYFRLARFNVIVISTIVISLFTTGTFFIVSYTSLKEYIPGYSSTELRLNAAKNAFRLDSVIIAMEKSRIHFASLQKALSGETEIEDSIVIRNNENNIKKESFIDLGKGLNDSLLREIVFQEDKYNIIGNKESKVDFVLFTPAKGEISEKYNPEEKHYGVDIVLAKDAPIKSVNEGTVIFSEWSAETGYVIIIEHPYRLISVYKHNSALSKIQGDNVKAGEVIATAGNTGEYSTGWHLHFELWSEGYSMNPIHFIDFKSEEL
tara:strand:- start:1161 stop:2042 length:882 start_codon:yes stop_codon:yes gene_type:complete